MNTLMSEDGRSVRGNILVTIGFLLFALAIFGPIAGIPRNPISDFVEDLVLLPVIMIFVGRSMQRRAKRQKTEAGTSGAPTTGGNPGWMEEGRLPTLEDMLRPKPVPVLRTPQSASRQPAKAPSTAPEPPAVTQPRPSAPATMPAGVPVPYVSGARAIQPHYPKPGEGPRPKTSEEMIVEAKRRLNEKR